ncbi:MAG: VOC family protein [Rhodospirillaceae bacterium]|nr:VOC family protein [Rhodospirillaceae bacterium]
MNKSTLNRFAPLGAVLGVGLVAGFALGQAVPAKPQNVSGIGGVFFKSANPQVTAAWYQKHLGVPLESYDDHFMARFLWKDANNAPAYTVWSPFKKDTTYFAPGTSEFMVNYVVRDLDGLLKQLADDGIALEGKPQSDEFGKFAWIMDPEGRKIELWQPPKPKSR